MIDVAAIMCPKDMRNLARLPRMQAIYDALWRVSERHQPKTILEIGVRAGYSAYTLISASPNVQVYVGIDMDDREHYGKPATGGAWLDWAEKLLGGLDVDFNIIRGDSQALKRLPCDGYPDLVHVDGDHTFEGCLHDMNISWPSVAPGGVMVVDDATYLPGPRKACEAFNAIVQDDTRVAAMRSFMPKPARVYLEPSPTGSMVYVKEGDE